MTAADRASEALIDRRIREVRPDDGMLGEEGAERPGTTGLRWVVDPLDGTVNYLYRIPQWCVSVACEDADGPLVGVVHDPNRRETFVGSRDAGASVGGAALRIGEVADLGGAIVATGFSYEHAVRADQGRSLAGLLGGVRDLRRFGAAALDLAWVADGRVDGYLEFGLQPWDWAAGRLLIAEAGGTSSFHDVVLGGRSQTGLVAGNRTVHDGLVGWLGTDWTHETEGPPGG